MPKLQHPVMDNIPVQIDRSAGRIAHLEGNAAEIDNVTSEPTKR
jgi:hypothetical protein